MSRAGLTALLLLGALGGCSRFGPSRTDPRKSGDGNPVDAGTIDAVDIKAVNQAVSTASIPQLTAARGGSIGIPSAGAVSGLQANVDTQLFGDKTNAEAFAQLGGLRINKYVSVDVFAELLDQDLPRFLHDGGMVQREMFTTKLSAAGMRVRYRTKGVLLVSDLQTSACMKSLAGLKKTLKEALRDDTPLPDCNPDAFLGEAFSTFSLGAHALRRSSAEPDGIASNGAAVELMAQRENASWMYFGGVSAIRLSGAIDKAGSSIVEFPKFSVFRASAGIEYRGSQLDIGLIPRVGAYGVAGHAWWHDPYTFDTIERRVQSTEFELGVYAGGKFSDKFSGILALRMLRPFGTAQDTVFILSLIPSASSSSPVVP